MISITFSLIIVKKIIWILLGIAFYFQHEFFHLF